MNTAFAKETGIVWGDRAYTVDDLFNEEFFRYCNDHVAAYRSPHFWANEIYLNVVQAYLLHLLLLKQIPAEGIDLSDARPDIYPFMLDAAESLGKTVTGRKRAYLHWRRIKGFLYICASAVYLVACMLRLPTKSALDMEEGRFAVVRTKAARKKIAVFADIALFQEDLLSNDSLYCHFPKRKRLGWVLHSWLQAFPCMHQCCQEVSRYAGRCSTFFVWDFYGRRMVHTLLYGHLLDAVFAGVKKNQVFVSGNNLDRFALIEEELASKYGIPTLCIPHGLEYGFTLPHCFTGQTFYTTSEKAAQHLNAVYHTGKFLFDREIAGEMFRVGKVDKQARYLVFFTEPREVHVNIQILDALLPKLREQGLQLYIKLHPKDNPQDYQKYQDTVRYLQDFNSSIAGNICFARKSTTLIEAVYNDSAAAAILTNPKDIAIFNTFASLQDECIEKCYSVDQLFTWICGQYR